MPLHQQDNPDVIADAQQCRDYERVAEAIRYLKAHRHEQPRLAELARHVGLSPHHFQRTFKRWSGVSPKQLLAWLTVDAAKPLLDAHWSVLDVSDELGLSGPARLHDAFVAIEAMTPGEFKHGGAGLTIRRGVHASPFGPVRVMATERGICSLEFLPVEQRSPEAMWPNAQFVDDAATGADLVAALSDGVRPQGVRLHLKGTNFQVQVWRGLLALPAGCVTGYGALAAAIGHPRAARAVGSALGHNPVAWLIPCHRVIRESGTLGDYRYGAARKHAMLAWEGARAEASARAVA